MNAYFVSGEMLVPLSGISFSSKNDTDLLFINIL